MGAVTVVEGNDLTINCTDGVNTGLDLLLRENGVQLINENTPPNEVNGAVHVFQLPVDRAKDSNTYECQQVLTAVISAQTTLTVVCKWNGVMVRQASVIISVLSVAISE